MVLETRVFVIFYIYITNITHLLMGHLWQGRLDMMIGKCANLGHNVYVRKAYSLQVYIFHYAISLYQKIY